MPTDVEELTGLEHGEFMDIMSAYLYESIGAAEFGHISFTKAVTILGLGKNSLVPVAVDEHSRMDAKGKLTLPKASR